MICLNGATLYPGPGKAENELNLCLTSSGKSCLRVFHAATYRYWLLLEVVYFHIRWANLMRQQTSMLPSHLLPLMHQLFLSNFHYF